MIGHVESLPTRPVKIFWIALSDLLFGSFLQVYNRIATQGERRHRGRGRQTLSNCILIWLWGEEIANGSGRRGGMISVRCPFSSIFIP